MRQRKTASRLTNCPFEVVGKKVDDLWMLTIKNGEHTHEPSKDVSDHPSCRCFTEEEVLLIREMTAAGKRPRPILKALRQQNPSLVSDSRNVYHVKAKIRRESESGEEYPRYFFHGSFTFLSFFVPNSTLSCWLDTSVSMCINHSQAKWQI